MLSWSRMSTASRIVVFAGIALVVVQLVLLATGNRVNLIITIAIAALALANYVIWRRDEAAYVAGQARQESTDGTATERSG